ncbi:MAG TPA: AraC family transcriptional regulator, partial [Sulfurimonas sp.]|nr:AraC family transcriptional regulator [Sulfurimonas sp.]
MKLSIFQPSEALKDIVKQYVVVNSLEDHEKLWVLPNAGNFLIFNPGLEVFFQKHNSNNVSFTVPKEFCVGIKSNDIIQLKV